jgi:replicative DNA helicase
MAPLLTGALERIEELYNTGGDITGLTTGFIDLDKKTSGLQPSDLVIVAGRPSMGKTAFAMNLVENASAHTDKPILVFSMEMPAEQLVVRMMASLGKIDQSRLRTGKLQQDDWPKLSAAMAKLKETTIFIDDTPALTPTEVRARARRLSREHGDLAVIMVDYLQLMQVAGAAEGRTAEISEISRNLKAIAKEFRCPVVALSQLNRSLEQRPNKRPVNSDLRESGAIEQDADVVMFIYRDEVYHEDSPDKGVAEIIIGKQRNGPIGTCRLVFQGEFTRFENLARDDYAGY